MLLFFDIQEETPRPVSPQITSNRNIGGDNPGHNDEAGNE